MKIEFSMQIFFINSKIPNLTKIPPVEPSCFMWTEEQTKRQMERHDEANSLSSQFCKSASNTKFTEQTFS